MARHPRSPTPLLRWAGGVHFDKTRLWCDAPARDRGLCFVSGSDVALPRQHAGRLLCTERTARLLTATTEALVTPIRRPFSFGKARLELLPGGRLPGSAQLLVELDGERVLYAGRTIAARRLTAEPRQSGVGHILVVDAPDAVHERVPSEGDELARLVTRATALAAARVVVVAAPDALAVEVCGRLGEAGVSVRVHRRWAPALAALRELGVAVPKVATWRAVGLVPLGEVVLWPTDAAVPHADAVVLTVDAPGCAPAADDHFVVGNSLDRAGLVQLCRESETRIAYLTAGYCAEVARALAQIDVVAHPLGPPTQMALSIGS